ncbi:MAG: hypothetical protein CTY34_11210 [Methylobacter sp.]|nr:MAG: hypothetical protein CTY34_11210 [Methylobacter sp.]PPD02592.1 MAG: hypothetical protein CTY29_12500 [Methylobacter sp.]PPD19033.1 MAG: hypothetical protein CTY24_11905 [Methylobacter sp.]PPD32193.1 MAG: hypothetical protein CTY18_11500 [Methylomonas sp.]
MFLTSLPIIFTFTRLFNPIEFGIFLLAILAWVTYSSPAPYPQFNPPPGGSFYTLLNNLWLGQAKLWQAFWPFFLLINAAFIYIDYRTANNTYTIASWTTVHGMLFLPTVWWVISVWRCSSHTRRRWWAVAARTLVLYLVFDFLLRLLIRFEYPNLLFDCRLLTIEYGDCF